MKNKRQKTQKAGIVNPVNTNGNFQYNQNPHAQIGRIAGVRDASSELYELSVSPEARLLMLLRNLCNVQVKISELKSQSILQNNESHITSGLSSPLQMNQSFIDKLYAIEARVFELESSLPELRRDAEFELNFIQNRITFFQGLRCLFDDEQESNNHQSINHTHLPSYDPQAEVTPAVQEFPQEPVTLLEHATEHANIEHIRNSNEPVQDNPVITQTTEQLIQNSDNSLLSGTSNIDYAPLDGLFEQLLENLAAQHRHQE